MWPGVSKNLQAEVREVESIAVLRRLEGVLRLRARAEVDGGAAAVAEFEVAGDEVGVKVGEEDVADFEPELRGVGEVLVDVALRVDDDGRGSGFVTDEVLKRAREQAEANTCLRIRNAFYFLMNSTRRLLARPSGASFEAMGLAAPKPLEERRAASMANCETSTACTA